MVNSHCVSHWCTQQDRIALSTAEAELKASCKGMVEMFGLQQTMLFRTGKLMPLTHKIDASATEKVFHRQGSGAMKHLEIKNLWIQAAILDYKVQVIKIPRVNNYADALCSVNSPNDFEDKLQGMNFEFPSPGLRQGGRCDCTASVCDWRQSSVMGIRVYGHMAGDKMSG